MDAANQHAYLGRIGFRGEGVKKFIEKNQKLHGRQMLLLSLDTLAVGVSIGLAGIMACSFIYIPSYFRELYGHFALIAGVCIAVNYLLGSYRSLWRYAGTEEMVRLLLGFVALGLVLKTALTIFHVYSPPTFVLLFSAIFTAFMVVTRFSYRVSRRLVRHSALNKEQGTTRVLIVGAGAAGSLLVKEMLDNPRIHKVPVAFADDNIERHGKTVAGIKVVGSIDHLPEMAARYNIDEIIIAIPSATKAQLKRIVELAQRSRRIVSIIPAYDELLDGKVSLNQIREVEIKDLLGRDEIKTDLQSVSEYLKGKTVLVTGGGGSIGSELCRQIASFTPKQLLILDCYENSIYDLQNELQRKFPNLNLDVLVASVRDYERMEQIFTESSPQVVFHAAAHKHVPLMERNPMEAVKNNVFGTYHVTKLSHDYGVEKMVLISTDKAVNPTNVMGATKRMAERILTAYNSISNTEFAAVRFGNVLGSNGSVIPLFKKQIEEGGPVTVTHKDIIRYFMTIPEAVRLVLQAGALAEGGEIFVLDMGDPVKIVDLAEELIRLSGFEPYEDIDIVFTGLRPGEKLYEELLMSEEGLIDTKHKKIFIGKQTNEGIAQLEADLSTLRTAAETEKGLAVKEALKAVIDTYKEPEQVVEVNRKAVH